MREGALPVIVSLRSMFTLDAAALLRALEAGETRLAARVDEVNRLNVYPVPDGDTGTNMLHTVRAAVVAARRAVDGGAGALMAAAAPGRTVVAKTPELLPVLKRAGVVDAGAQGLVYIIEGMADMVAGRVTTVERTAEGEAALVAAAAAEPRPDLAGGEWGYDVQYLVARPS